MSDGGGAESVSDSQAVEWIIEGKHFNPTAKGSLFKPSGYVSNLPWPMFYRQSGLFVKYLSDFDEVSFKALLTDLESKEKFKAAFVKRFNVTPDEMFASFLEQKRAARK